MSLILSGTDGLSDIDGTAATPAIRGTDANTGIFFPAADQVAISTGGTQRAVVNASGNVGIGGIIPGSAPKLSMYGGIRFLAAEAASATYTGIGSVVTDTVCISTVATERIRVTAAGGVSFGATGTAYGTSGQFLTSAGDAPPTWTTIAAPSVTVYTSGSGTYTTPSGAKWLQIQMVGGGGGGGGSGAGGGTGGTGGTTTFGTSTLTCNGGTGGIDNGAGGDGGSATITVGSGLAVSGGKGGGPDAGSANNLAGGMGGSSALGGNGGCGGGDNAGQPNASPSTGQPNTGGGGGGASFAGSFAAAGGGAGGFIDAIITSPSASYSYAVGAAGTGGTAGTGTGVRAGAAGGSGVIYITAYF